MYKGDRFAGCIYTESGNSKNFTDPNTVVYGHNMRNGSMFQNLHYYEDPEFFEQNPFVYIYTEDKIRIYEVFASYIYDDRHILNSFNFNDPKVFAQYLEDIIHVHYLPDPYPDDMHREYDGKQVSCAGSTCLGGDGRRAGSGDHGFQCRTGNSFDGHPGSDAVITPVCFACTEQCTKIFAFLR